MAKSPLEQIKELDEKRSALITDAKQEALAKVDEALANLRNLGFSYKLVLDKGDDDTSLKGTMSDEPCKLCGFRTDPPHDKRRHRWSKGFEDRAFNQTKLRELKLTRLDE